jgi:hypothetical protein
MKKKLNKALIEGEKYTNIDIMETIVPGKRFQTRGLGTTTAGATALQA